MSTNKLQAGLLTRSSLRGAAALALLVALSGCGDSDDPGAGGEGAGGNASGGTGTSGGSDSGGSSTSGGTGTSGGTTSGGGASGGETSNGGSSSSSDAGVTDDGGVSDAGMTDDDVMDAGPGCGGEGEPCCAGGALEDECETGFACNDIQDDGDDTNDVCSPCGGEGERCCDPDDSCEGSLTCPTLPGNNNDICTAP